MGLLRKVVSFWLVVQAVAPRCLAEVVPIPEARIAVLQKELREQRGTRASSTSKRRAYKNMVRDAEDLIEASPTAPNRFRVFSIMLESQKRLLSVDPSDRNRAALFETCGKLAKAPDEYAELRLEADLMLSEKALSEKNADVKERAEALATLIQRYRETPAEAKSLMMAALIAPKLEAFDLEKQIDATLSERFAGDFDVIEWRRKHRDFSHLPVQFKGMYMRADGTTLSFPVDGLGHTCLMVFWSKETPEIEQQLAAYKELQTRFPGYLDVYSFNLDELPDAGVELLGAMGLDWTPMRLPGGRNNQAYRVYAAGDPIAIRVNAHGHAHLSTSRLRKLSDETPIEENIDDPRYLAQLQSLLVGDFLVAGESKSATLAAIQACFVAPPMSYRLTRAEAVANYGKAETLSREAIKQHADSSDLWRMRNCRIIALMGLWKSAMEPQHFEAAVKEARTALADLNRPAGADVVPRFCLAREALRKGDAKPELVLSELIRTTGGHDAPVSAHAAASMLAVDANAGDLHAAFRQKVLDAQNGDPALWPVISFLRDQNHSYRLFKANFYHPPSMARRSERATLRSNAAALDTVVDPRGPLQAEFKTLGGEAWSLPQSVAGKLTLLMFVEPPSDPGTNFPVVIKGEVTEDARGTKKEFLGVMQQAFQFADEHVQKKLQVVAAFLSEDADHVQALVTTNAWPCEAVMVPGGLAHPLVRRLGILSADRVPHVVLLRPDGTMAWMLSGIVHPQLRSEGVGELVGVVSRGMKSNIEKLAMENSIDALEQGEHAHAAQLFSGPFPIDEKLYGRWIAPRLHGRALAHLGQKEWEAALTDIDNAIVSHERTFNQKNMCSCRIVAGLFRDKARIHEHLGQGVEALAARQRADRATGAHGANRYGAYHQRLRALGKAQK